MSIYYLYCNYWFIGQRSDGTHYLSEQPAKTGLTLPTSFHAVHPNGQTIEIDDNYASYTTIETINETQCVLFYHVTMDEFLPDIMQEGLRPKIGTLSEEINESEPAIYLFPHVDTMNDALGSWMGEAYEEMAEDRGVDPEDIVLHALEVRIPVSQLHEMLEESTVGFEAISRKTIPPAWLSYHSKQ